MLKSRKGRSIATKTEVNEVSSDVKKEKETLENDINSIENDEDILKKLLDNGEAQSALFLSRRLIANGEEWAQKYYDIAMNNLS